jgi:hypothetical protein
MIELNFGLLVLQFGDESSTVSKSELVQGSSDSVRCFRLPPVGTRSPGLNTTLMAEWFSSFWGQVHTSDIHFSLRR